MVDHWVSEAGVTRSTSMEWACWLLGFLLSPDVRVSLLRGALHNSEVFEALVGYLRTSVPPASPVVKPRVVGLLSQLLQDPGMFLPHDQPDVWPARGFCGLPPPHSSHPSSLPPPLSTCFPPPCVG